MTKRLQLVTIAGLALSALVCSAEPSKVNRQLAHLPAAVRETIRAKVGHGKLDSIDRDTEDDGVVYDVEMTLGGKMRGFTVDETGQLLDEEVFLPELPSAVQRTIVRQTGGGTLEEIDKSVDDGETSYDVEMTRNGNTRSFTVDGDGSLLEEQVFLNELPVSVRQTVTKQAGENALGEIHKFTEDGEIDYDVEMTRNGDTRHFTVGPTGKLVDEEVSLTELPEALQSAINKQAGGDKVSDINRCFDDGEISYDVDIDRGTGGCTFNFDSDGQLFSTDEDISLTDAPSAVREQINSLAAGGKCLGVSKITEDGEISYDVEIGGGGVDKVISVDSDGKVIPDEN